MKHFAMIISALALAGCMETTGGSPTVEPGEPVSEGQIMTEAQFLATIADKDLTLLDDDGAPQDAKFVIASGGTWSGAANGNPFRGTWEWRDGYWCRTIAVSYTHLTLPTTSRV